MCGGKKSHTQNSGFGYNRKDVLTIGAGLLCLGYGLYYALQKVGIESGMAGNWVQMIIFLGISVGWVSTYFYRVATKNTTYFQQLKDYEEAVMAKRLEEMIENQKTD
eukprot:gnl/TRDRNA2_/TRDRNA2_165292_c0_seq2.p1 gnl/TRDRNA2_/TRDRNA2_165292_c0~~gnl/TRDRNA2_/TRDRNA2_165292_c0_seq2.p1  ORF type:complete len:107 (+),score=0.62 gnl/TRDRNA2_/TRDRNA2_165292_c0_seq2:268-588(+)